MPIEQEPLHPSSEGEMKTFKKTWRIHISVVIGDTQALALLMLFLLVLVALWLRVC